MPTAAPSAAAASSEPTSTESHREELLAKQAAKQAERASVSLHALRFFRAEPVVADAYATFVTAQGFTCLVPRFGLEAFVHAWPRDGGQRATYA